MKKIIVGFTIMVLLAGCSSKLSFTEMNMNRVNKDIEEFLQNAQEENGTYLYYDYKQNVYIFLNGYHVTQGNKALHFSDFHLEANGDTLNILFHHESTADYSNQELNNRQLYKVKLDKEYDKIMLFDNNEEVAFHTIYN